MENQKKFRIPKNILARMQVVHFGKILFNMQFIALAIMFASVLSFIIPVFYYLFLVFTLLLSLFTLFASPTFMSLWSGGNSITKVTYVLAQSWGYTVPIVAVLAIASIVCLSFDKTRKHVGKIVVSSILLVLALIVLFLKLVNSGVFQ